MFYSIIHLYTSLEILYFVFSVHYVQLLLFMYSTYRMSCDSHVIESDQS